VATPEMAWGPSVGIPLDTPCHTHLEFILCLRILFNSVAHCCEGMKGKNLGFEKSKIRKNMAENQACMAGGI
jgi:hypothetical protein